MKRGLRWSALLGVLATPLACATYWPTLDGSSRLSAEEAYRCAKAEATRVGFKPTNWNDGRLSFDARRRDPEATERLPREERQIDQLRVQVKRADGDAKSALSARAETMVQQFSREGWVTKDVPASQGVQDAARSVLKQCS
jgi:hypothetical protein